MRAYSPRSFWPVPPPGLTAGGRLSLPLVKGEADMEASPAAKLCGFLILLVVVFIAAHAAGAHEGPVVSHSQPGHSQPMNMNMGHP